MKTQKKQEEENPIADETKLLVPTDRYLKTGSHIGTQYKTGEMKKFIYKTRKDGLYVFNITNIDERIRLAAKLLSQYEPNQITAISRKLYGHQPAKMFAKETGANAITGRFIPGTFTNPQGQNFKEPKIVIITEPETDEQAIKEATNIHAPIIAICSTNNTTKNIDLIIPMNNKGRKSLALAYWLLAREYQKERKTQINEKEYEEKLPLFEQQIKEIKEKPRYESRFRRRPPNRFRRRN
jgi:small subunit ribosomal protein S2